MSTPSGSFRLANQEFQMIVYKLDYDDYDVYYDGDGGYHLFVGQHYYD